MADKTTPASTGWQAVRGRTENGEIMTEFRDRFNSWLLERQIRRERIAVVEADTTEEARFHAERMRRLIERRSGPQIARMERDKGLA